MIFDFGWLSGLLPFVVIGGFVILLLVARASVKRASEARADFDLESALQREITRRAASQSPTTWTPPNLPYSVMACIWTYRLVGATQSVGRSERDYGAVLRTVYWNYRREAPYIIASALLRLRDAGRITMSVRSHSGPIDSMSRVRIEGTDVAVAFTELPLVEGGLLMACEDLANRRFLKTTTPSVHSVVGKFIQAGGADPFKWVIGLAVDQARDLGLYEPVIKKRHKPVYVLEHLAACDNQVVAFTSRWREFAINEPELHQRLLTEAAFGVLGRQSSA